MTAPLHRVYRTSGLGRPIDRTWATNRWIVRLAAVSALVSLTWAWLTPGGGGLAAAWLGVQCGLASFLAWAITREVAPDFHREAFLPALVAPWVVVTSAGAGSVWTLFVALMSSRIVNRSTGKAMEPGDALVLLAFLVLAFVSNLAFGAVVAVALVLDVILPAPAGQPKRVWPLGPAALAVMAASLRLADIGLAPSWPDLASGGSALAAVLVAVLLPTPTSPGDVDGQPLDALRVRLGAAVGLATWALASADPRAPSAYPVIGGAVALAVAVGVARHRLGAAGAA